MSIRNLIENHFHRYYLNEVAKDFAVRATFVDSSYLYAMDDSTPRCAIEEIQQLSFARLENVMPTTHEVTFDDAYLSNFALALRCFATHMGDNLVYGLIVWVKVGRKWKFYNLRNHKWETVREIPYDDFYVSFQNRSANHQWIDCSEIEVISDSYFVY